MSDLNLARRPFVNLKPVRRTGLLLLLMALALAAVNAVLYWEHFTGEGETRSRSQDLTRQINEAEAEADRLRQQISSLDIDTMNRRTGFVNLEIERRRFSWSRLFDRLVEAQPESVRLTNMSPDFGEQRRRRSRGRRVASNDVTLELRGVAKSSEAILEFVDGLFAHPAFRDPDLNRESLLDDGTWTFDLNVLYLRNVRDETAGAAGEETQADTVDPEEKGVA